MSALLDRQFLFTKLLAKWIDEVYRKGYAVKLRETGLFEERKGLGRDGEVRLYWDKVHSGTSSKAGGCHYLQLATDVDLFVQVAGGSWQYITDTEHPAWVAMGEFWESLDPLCRWGGRFSHKDGNHLSITYDGRA